MSIYQREIPCIYLAKGTEETEELVTLAKQKEMFGACELVVFDLSDCDEAHEASIDCMKKMNREIHIPMVAGGNVKRLEDVKKILYAGAKRAVVNLSKPTGASLLEEAAKRFGKEKLAVSIENKEAFIRQKEWIETYAEEVIFMDRANVETVAEDTTLKVTAMTDTKQCIRFSTRENLLESRIKFSEFRLNKDGLIPVIVQEDQTGEVLMLAYMNEDAYEWTLKTGKMTYYSRSRKERWIKGETSGHYQYVKSLSLDCDNDTILAKVDQVGVACHTGAHSCFFQPLVEADTEELNPLQVFESVYATILDRKQHPKEGSYTNYLFDKGIDKILKKVGEEATELVIAAKNPNPEEIKYELSDFLYHAMVLMVERGVTWEDIVKELADR